MGFENAESHKYFVTCQPRIWIGLLCLGGIFNICQSLNCAANVMKLSASEFKQSRRFHIFMDLFARERLLFEIRASQKRPNIHRVCAFGARVINIDAVVNSWSRHAWHILSATLYFVGFAYGEPWALVWNPRAVHYMFLLKTNTRPLLDTSSVAQNLEDRDIAAFENAELAISVYEIAPAKHFGGF